MKPKPIEIPEDDFLALSAYRLSLIRRLEIETCATLREIQLDGLRAVCAAVGKPVPSFKFDQLDLNTTRKRLAAVIHGAHESMNAGVFPYPFALEVVGDAACVMVQPSSLLDFALRQRTLRIRGGAVAFNRQSFRAALMESGFVVGQCERFISGRRCGHLLILDVQSFESFYREHGPQFN